MTVLSVCTGRLPGARTFGERGSSEKPESRVVQQDARAGDHRRRAEQAEDALDERDGVAVAVDDREIGRIRGQGRGLDAIGGSAGDRAAALRDECAIQELFHDERHGPRIAGHRVAVRERELLDLDHGVDLLRAPPAHRPQIEPVGDRELLQEHVTLRHGRLPDDAQAAVARLDRQAPVGAVGREIVGRDPPTDPGDRLGDALGQLAAIERVRPASRDRAKRRREIGLLEQLA